MDLSHQAKMCPLISFHMQKVFYPHPRHITLIPIFPHRYMESARLLVEIKPLHNLGRVLQPMPWNLRQDPRTTRSSSQSLTFRPPVWCTARASKSAKTKPLSKRIISTVQVSWSLTCVVYRAGGRKPRPPWEYPCPPLKAAGIWSLHLHRVLWEGRVPVCTIVIPHYCSSWRRKSRKRCLHWALSRRGSNLTISWTSSTVHQSMVRLTPASLRTPWIPCRLISSGSRRPKPWRFTLWNSKLTKSGKSRRGRHTEAWT